jgi:hypothetical protein
MKQSSPFGPKQVTIADLCEALTSGAIPAQIKNGEYVIRHRDVARLAQAEVMKPPACSKKPTFTVVGVA